MKKAIFKIEKVISSKSSSWNKEDDKLLLNLSYVNVFPKRNKINWRKISSYFHHKTPLQCFKRFRVISPIFKKGKWTKEEDEQVLSLINQLGKSWTFISKIMKNRTSKQIRLRYNNYLNPELKNHDFSKDEDMKIITLHKVFSNQWSKFKNFLPGRSDKVIKRRFFKLIKQKLINFCVSL